MSTGFAFGTRLPIVAAPMFLVSGPELVIAASQAGIVGSFPTPNCRTTAELDVWLGTIHDALAAKGETAGPIPWAVNLVTHSSNVRIADDLALIAEYRVPIVITAMGSPKPAAEAVKGYGGTLIADVVDVRLARKAVEVGVDGLACVSAGAGGHTGHLSPFAFVAAIRGFFDGIIAVGGGIATGASVAGALAAGADLVYMGTRFLVSKESLAPAAYKQMIVDHGVDDLIVSAAITGARASWLKPSLQACGIDTDALSEERTARDYGSAETAQKRWKDVWAAGQGIEAIHSVAAVSDIVDDIEAGYWHSVDRLNGIAVARRPAKVA